MERGVRPLDRAGDGGCGTAVRGAWQWCIGARMRAAWETGALRLSADGDACVDDHKRERVVLPACMHAADHITILITLRHSANLATELTLAIHHSRVHSSL